MPENKEPPSTRTLDQDAPELKEYLRPGLRVLDVGCGPGTITLGVAAAVSPGEVVGIDPNEVWIEHARDRAAEVGPALRATFANGDSHKLDFPDGSFDIVYSHTALHCMLDPVTALKEQKRVTKQGGWVIASGVRDSTSMPRYPACPNWQRVVAAIERYQQAVLAGFRQSAADPRDYAQRERANNPTGMIYYDLSGGRKVPEWFSGAGFRQFHVRVKAGNLQYSGSEAMRPNLDDMVLLNEPENAVGRQLALWHEQAIAKGFLTRKTVEKAQEELRAWYQDPRAFNFWTLVFAAGLA